MQTPDRFFGNMNAFRRIPSQAAHSAHLWLLPAVLLALALCFGALPPWSPVQAQDAGTGSGQQAEVDYDVSVDTTGANLDRFCLGSTANLPLAIRRRVQVAGNPDAGSERALGVSFEVSSSNTGVVTADIAGGMPGRFSNMLVTTLVLTAVSGGTASISVAAHISTPQADYERHASPISAQVVPCQIRVDLQSLWVTTINHANFLLVTTLHADLVINRTTGLYMDRPNVHWEGTTNRFPGCLASHQALDTGLGYGASIQAEVVDNELSLTIEIDDPYRGDYLLGCEHPHYTRRPAFNDCSIQPDGVCPETWTDPHFRVETLQNIRFPLTGGTKSFPQRLTHDQGGAAGSAYITVTPHPQ